MIHPSRRAVLTCALSLLAARSAAALVPPASDEEAEMSRLAGSFLEAYQAPALSVAIGWRGDIVYKKAFGFADLDTRRPATPSDLFRIASVSKPLTSVTLFTLIEADRLKLSDRVFGPGGVLGEDYGGPPYLPGVDEIEIAQLMTHTAGGWSNDERDPMFRDPALDRAALIASTLRNRPLDHRPGDAYAYSNFGYCVLGRVIEKLTGKSYEQAVKDAVLTHCGVSDMRIGGNTRDERAPGEVGYYSVREHPYDMNVRRMDSHGGWIARPEDYVRFLMAVSGFSPPASLLTAASIAEMTTPSAANARYAKGWSVNSQNNWWHSGSLPGTTTVAVRAHDGFCWAAFANSRRSGMADALDALIWDMLDAAKSWKR